MKMIRIRKVIILLLLLNYSSNVCIYAQIKTNYNKKPAYDINQRAISKNKFHRDLSYAKKRDYNYVQYYNNLKRNNQTSNNINNTDKNTFHYPNLNSNNSQIQSDINPAIEWNAYQINYSIQTINLKAVITSGREPTINLYWNDLSKNIYSTNDYNTKPKVAILQQSVKNIKSNNYEVNFLCRIYESGNYQFQIKAKCVDNFTIKSENLKIEFTMNEMDELDNGLIQTSTTNNEETNTAYLTNNNTNIQYHNYKKIAFLFGVSKYYYISNLDNVSNDLQGMSDSLEGLGYKTIICSNATGSKMREKLTRFNEMSKNSEKILIYFSGHGCYRELDGKNYILAADATDEINEAYISIDFFMNSIENPNLKIFIFDCCRSDYSKGTNDNVLWKHKDGIKIPSNSLVAFGTSQHNPAYATGKQKTYSIFTESLLIGMKKYANKFISLLDYASLRSNDIFNSQKPVYYTNIKEQITL